MFKYYITDLYAGDVRGTDSDEDAANFSDCEDFFVVDSSTGEWLTASGDRRPIEPYSDAEE